MSNPKYVRKFTALFTASLMVFSYVPRGWGKDSAAVAAARQRQTTGFASQQDLDLLNGKSPGVNKSAPAAGNSADVHYGDSPALSDFKQFNAEAPPASTESSTSNVNNSSRNSSSGTNQESGAPQNLADMSTAATKFIAGQSMKNAAVERDKYLENIEGNRSALESKIKTKITELQDRQNGSGLQDPGRINALNLLLPEIEACVPNDVKKAIKDCYSTYETELNASEVQLSNISDLQSKIETKQRDSILPFSGAQLSGEASSTFKMIENRLLAARTVCQKTMTAGEENKCESTCKSPFQTTSDKELEPIIQESNRFFKYAKDQCKEIYDKQGSKLAILNKFNEAIQGAEGFSSSAMNTHNSLNTTVMTGMGIAAVGMIVQGRQENAKQKAEADKAANNAANAVIQTAAGQVDCRAASGSGITNPDCKAPLMSYCSNPQKAKDVGCAAFDKSICASGGSTSYCVGKQADEYCDRSNAGLADSPSCMWIKDRPSSCRSQPDDIKCMSNISQADLKSKCEKFNNDPLCRASASGQMVLQPISGSGVPNLSTPAGSNNPSRTPSSDLNLSQSTSEAHRWMCQQGLVADCTLPQ
ncbi:MAG: hypothetical protein ABL927_00725 [Bdellovibrionales bacterium]